MRNTDLHSSKPCCSFPRSSLGQQHGYTNEEPWRKTGKKRTLVKALRLGQKSTSTLLKPWTHQSPDPPGSAYDATSAISQVYRTGVPKDKIGSPVLGVHTVKIRIDWAYPSTPQTLKPLSHIVKSGTLLTPGHHALGLAFWLGSSQSAKPSKASQQD